MYIQIHINIRFGMARNPSEEYNFQTQRKNGRKRAKCGAEVEGCTSEDYGCFHSGESPIPQYLAVQIQIEIWA